MAASDVDICNSALLKLGGETITALTDVTRRAQLCNQQYDRIRKKLLRSHPWNFAIKRSELVQNATAPTFEYDVAFDLPADMLRAIREEDKLIDWKVEGQTIVTNESSFNLVYIADITDTTQFDESFDELFALHLAYELAYPLVQSVSLKESLKRELNEATADIRSFDAQEGQPEILETTQWLVSRQ